MEGQTNQDPNTTASYGTIPNQLYGYGNGAGSPRQNALLYQLENDNAQAELAATGGSSRRSRKHRASHIRKFRHSRRHHKQVIGGQAAGTEMVVPSFPQTGPATSPLNATSASVAANQAALDAKVSACNDCYATGTCNQSMGCPQQGGKYRRGRTASRYRNLSRRRNRPYAMDSERIRKSAFKDESSVRRTLKRHKSGKRIGFTQRSSLRSMGLIPRKDGSYRLGKKYSH